jgi:aldehyde:ferredoxin oxidoreductase
MAEGVARMSERFGPATADFNITVKKQELPMHEPRLKKALGVGYAIAPVGADHMMNMHDTDIAYESEALKRINSVLEKPIGPQRTSDLGEDKLRAFHAEVNWMHFQDCAVNCHFYVYNYDHMAQALSGVTGVDFTRHDILNVGARAQTLSRLFNLREGFTSDDDKLPKRVMKAFKDGPLAGIEITDEAFEWAKSRYYELMGWDVETGVPGEGCLKEIGLTTLLNAEAAPTPPGRA